MFSPATNTTTFTYSVTSGEQPAISHWMLVTPPACGVPRITAVAPTSELTGWSINDNKTGITGIKFDRQYADFETRIVSLTLAGRWDSGSMEAVIKAGTAANDYHTVIGPVCGTPSTPTPLTASCPSDAASLVGPKWNDAGKNYATITTSTLPTFSFSGGVSPTVSIAYVLNGETAFVPVATVDALQFPIGVTVVTATATSASTNETKTCSYTVVVDYAGPRFRNPPAANSPYVVASCSRIVTFGTDLFVSSAGEIASFQSTPSSGATFPTGVTAVSFTVADTAGNVTTGVLNVVVTDTESPIINQPLNITAELDAGQCFATVAFAAPLVTDCNPGSVVFSPASGSRFPVGNTTVTLTATDTAGNPASTATFTVTVNPDTQKPVVTNLPPHQLLNTSAGSCSADFTFVPSATDNCPGVTVSSNWSGGAFPKGITTVTVTAVDAAGNTDSKSFNVTVVDVQAPTLVVPASIVQPTALGACFAPVAFEVTAGDNCPGATVTLSHQPGSVFPKGETVVTATATDTSGNTTVKSFVVLVVDREAPVVSVPANLVKSTDAGRCSAAVSFDFSATDNCPGVTVVASPASGTVFAKGSTLVTVTATDASGNTSAKTFTVTVNDTEAPAIAGPANIVAYLPGRTNSGVLNPGTATATDNCAIASLTWVRSDGATSLDAPFGVGVTTITWTAVDTSGNTTTFTQTVTFSSQLGAGGGLTLGFWHNKNGQSFVTEAGLAALRAANLRNDNGSAYDPVTAAELGKWLTSARATNMANMLSAQFTALTNNVTYRTPLLTRGVGGVDGTAYLYAPGTQSANAWGVARVNDLLAEANASLGANGLTVAASPTRTHQQALKDALDAANNNLNFVIIAR